MSEQRIYGKRKIRKGFGLPALLLVLVLLSVGSVYMIVRTRSAHDEFSMEYVSAREIPGFMQFTYYDRDEWSERLGMEFTGALTYGKLADLLEFLDVKEYIGYEPKRDNFRVERAVWNQIYVQILDILDTSGKVTKEKLLLLREPSDGEIETQKGIYQYDGVLAVKYQAYEAYVMENQLLGIVRELNEETVVENVYVTEQSDNVIFLYQNDTYQIPVETEEKLTDTVCDIYLNSGKVTKIYKKEDTIEGKLLTLEDARIEIEGYGSIERADRLPVYQVYGEREEKSISDIVIGNMDVSYIVAEKRVCAILLKKPAEITTVRVLLLNENQGIGREEVYVTASGNTRLRWGKKKKKYEAGTICKASDYLTEEGAASLKIENTGEGYLYLCDAEGNQTSLGYQGDFEIRKYEEGYVVVNVVSLEQYICGVVPSEMPATYPLEALKAQAVCARSYAGIQLLKGAYAKYGAHMDDSVNFQVYNKQERQESTTQAVNETTGMVICEEDRILEAYYYSTSFGHSGNYETWNLENDGSLDYLSGTWLKEEEPALDLSDETVFAEYIQSTDEECYDSFAKYFRWNAAVNLNECSDAIVEKINARKSVKPDSIQICPDEAATAGKETVSLSELGKVVSIATEGRNNCGGVKQLVVNFEKGSVDITDEYTMRAVLGCAVTQISFQDGSTEDNVSILPSAYFMISSGENGNYTLCGGGYGHGIGMSQNGAKGMAEQGYTYEEILKKFYQGIEVKEI